MSKPIVTAFDPDFHISEERWSAMREGDEGCIGFGETEAEAVADLFDAEEIQQQGEPQSLEDMYNEILAELTELEARAKKTAP